MNSTSQLHELLISRMGGSLSRHHELGIDSFLGVLGICVHPQVACTIPRRSFLWLSQNICCLSVQINYSGGDYLTLSDSYCLWMLFDQLVWSRGYVMLLRFMGTEEAHEEFIGDVFTLFIAVYFLQLQIIVVLDINAVFKTQF